MKKRSSSSTIGALLSHHQKQTMLKELSETEFRQRIIWPIFQSLGYKHYRDTCGPTEAGKDCYFYKNDEFGSPFVIAIQTKAVAVKQSMGTPNSQNAAGVIEQLQTAIQNPIQIDHLKINQRPNKVYFCCSHKIEPGALLQIREAVRDPNLTIWDDEMTIEYVDAHLPETWTVVLPEKLFYLRELHKALINASDAIIIPDSVGIKEMPCPITDERYVPQEIIRVYTEASKNRNQKRVETKYERKKYTYLLSKKSKKVLLTGDEGSGKTTILKRLGLEMIRRALHTGVRSKNSVPVLLRAMDMVKDDATIQEYIFFVTETIADIGKPVIEESHLKDGIVTLFLDGLDEIGNKEDKEAVTKKVEDFSNTYPNCRIVLSARPYSDLAKYFSRNGFTHYQIYPTELNQAEKIYLNIAKIKKANSLSVGIPSKEFFRQLIESHSFKMTPMMITLLSLLADTNANDLPPNLFEMLLKYSSLVLGQWDLNKGLDGQITWKRKEAFVKSLASGMHVSGRSDMAIEEYTELAQEFLEKYDPNIAVEQFSNEILRSGLLVQEGRYVRFRHRTFQEYFASYHLVPETISAEVLGDPWWRLTLVFGSSRNGDSFELFDRMYDVYPGVPKEKRFEANVTLGQSLQGCYLSPVAERLERYLNVIGGLSGSLRDLLDSEEEKFPLLTLVYFTLLGKDAVGSEIARHLEVQSHANFDRQQVFAHENVAHEYPEISPEEGQLFWMLLAKISLGEYGLVKATLQSSKALDERPLFGLLIIIRHLLHFRTLQTSERKLLNEIADILSPRCTHLVADVISEFGTAIFELSQGTVNVINAPYVTEEGQFQLIE